MRLLRKVLTFLVFWSLVGVSLAAAVQVWRQGFPQQDIHWAVSRISDKQFAESPLEDRLRLSWRLEREFSRGVDIEPAVEKLPPEERARFEENFNALTEVWLWEKVDTYFKIDNDRQRSQFLDRQANRVKSWPMFASATGASADDEDKARLERLTHYFISRSREMSAEERKRLQQFLFELAMRNYQVHQFFPGFQVTF